MANHINANYYDIESLDNLFTLANFEDHIEPSKQNIDLYYLCDDEDKILCEPDWQAKLLDKIYDKNRNYQGTVRFLNLKDESSVIRLSRTFGVSDARIANDPSQTSNYSDSFRLMCDTDKEYNPDIHPYYLGYNSYNYDTTMLAYFFDSAWSPKYQCNGKTNEKEKHCTFNPNTTAKQMRRFNDMLFSEKYKGSMPSALADTYNGPDYSRASWRIRKNMLMTGRHLDVARLNEKMTKVALKRLLGMLGLQILESRKLHGTNITVRKPDEFYDLIAYNISDVVNLKELFMHKLYQSQFALKKGLLTSYPELIYQEDGDTYKPRISPKAVRSDRLCIDSSSAQLATKTLCPYGHLKDIPAVSFNYPSENQAKLMGVKRVNVLDEAKKFFYNLYPQPHIRAEFDKIYDYYKSIEGKNFNDTEYYEEDWGERQPDGSVKLPYGKHSVSEIQKTDTCIPYFDKNGNPTSCFVLFGIGGIHGAEYNKRLFEADRAEWMQQMEDMLEAQTKYPDPVELRKAKKITMHDGRELSYSVFLKGGKKIADSEYKDLADKEPILFKVNSKGTTELNKKYVYTSVCKANHEDFTSYYPNLLRRMEAFYNEGLGYDRYGDIFYQKEDYGFLMKLKSRHLDNEQLEKYRNRRMPGFDANSPDITVEEQEQFANVREGTKLILNSASGAANATFVNNIRVDNQIISMRIIGQIFSWRIGQAQSYEGAFVPSTNTDGLYSVMEENINNLILEREAQSIGVAIEPEPLYLISKDSNNRVEYKTDKDTVISASGGSVGCRKGPTPTKNLAHPAIIDWALTEYLKLALDEASEVTLEKPFNRTAGYLIFKQALKEFDQTDALIMFQNIIASSPGTINYIYGKTEESDEPIVLQHYNRMFIMKNKSENTMHLYSAAARKITPAMAKKRKQNGDREVAVPEPIAKKVLEENGENIVAITAMKRDIVTKKVTNIDPALNILIENRNLFLMSDDERKEIIDGLDIANYVTLLENSYTKNWMNRLPGIEYAPVDDEDDDDDEINDAA